MKLTRRTVVKSAVALGAATAVGGCATSRPAAPAGATRTEEAPAPQTAAAAKTTAATRKKVLILGGTGFLGPALVHAARERGHEVTLFNRGKTRPGLFPDVEKLRGDRNDDLKALEGRTWDAVIDTSGYFPRVVKASAELLAPNVKQYLFISTVSVYAQTDLAGMDETGKLSELPAGTDPQTEKVTNETYGPLKAMSETAVEAAMPGRTTIIRPGLIVGPDDPTDRFTYWPVRIDAGGETIAPGTGADPVQFIDVRDLAEWCIHCVENGTVGVFNALGPEGKLTMREMLEGCRAASATPATLTWIPADFLEQQKVSPWSDLPVWVPGAGDSVGFATMSNARAVAAGLAFRPYAVTSKDTLAWWKTTSELRRAKLRAGLTKEREQEVLAAWKAQAAK